MNHYSINWLKMNQKLINSVEMAVIALLEFSITFFVLSWIMYLDGGAVLICMLYIIFKKTGQHTNTYITELFLLTDVLVILWTGVNLDDNYSRACTVLLNSLCVLILWWNAKAVSCHPPQGPPGAAGAEGRQGEKGAKVTKSIHPSHSRAVSASPTAAPLPHHLTRIVPCLELKVQKRSSNLISTVN